MTTDQLIRLIEQLPEGLEPADAIALLNADKRTWRAIPLKELEVLMGRSGMGLMLGQIAEAQATPDAIKRAVGEFARYIGSPRQTHLGTDEPDIAQQTADVLAGCVAAGLLTYEQVQAIYAIGGGLRVPAPVTQEDFNAALAKMARRDLARVAIEQERHRSAAVIAAIEMWHETGEGEPPVVEGK